MGHTPTFSLAQAHLLTHFYQDLFNTAQVKLQAVGAKARMQSVPSELGLGNLDRGYAIRL